MKHLIIILAVLFSISVKAQQRFPTGFPTQTNLGWNKWGYAMSDSGLIVANRDTNWLARYSGTVVFRPSNKKFYWFDSTTLTWNKFADAIDTTSLSNRINLKLNISDTTNKWWGVGKRWVDTVYRVNDSTIGFTINNGAQQTFQILGRSSSGGGAGTVTSVGLSLPSAFNVTPSSITTSGTFAVTGAGTTSQYIRGNGTLATTDTGMIPNFHLKVRGLLTGSSPITFNQTTGIIGITNANTTGTKGAASFTTSFSDNGSGVIDLADLVSAGSCTGCILNVDSKGRITSYSTGAGGATNNVNIGAGFRPVNAITQEMRTYFAGFGTRLDSVSNANGLTWISDTARSSGLPTYFYVDSLHNTIGVITADNGLTKTGDNIQLGGALIEPTNITSAAGANRIVYNGISAFGDGAQLEVTTSGSVGIAISGETTDGRGVFGSATTGVGVYGTATGLGGYGVFGLSTLGNAYYARSDSGMLFEGALVPTSNNTVITARSTSRASQSAGANGIGYSDDSYLQTTVASRPSHQFVYKLSNATDAAYTSAFEFYQANAGSMGRKYLISGAGQWTWDGYPGLTAQVDTTVYKPVAIDGSGNVVRMGGWAGSGGAGGGVTTMQPIGSSPNANAATISGNNLTMQPADESFGGVVTTLPQSYSGIKRYSSTRPGFNGFSALLNAQTIPTTIQPDSFYIATKYLGFGYIDGFNDGTAVQLFIQAENHVGDDSHIRMRKSYDQGATWTTSTIDTGTTAYVVTGLSGGVTQSDRIIAFTERLDRDSLYMIDLRVRYSDDRGVSWSSPTTISHGSHEFFQPYGGMCKIGGDSLLLSWYGYDTTAGANYASYIIKSGDDGVTWTSPITVVSNSTSKRTETSFVYLGGNAILALARSEVGDTLYGQYLSVNNGNTWQYQGQVSFGHHGTPAWLKAFKAQNGKRAVGCYYRDGTNIHAVYSLADSIVLGPSKWDLTTDVVIGQNVMGSGYVQVFHPRDEMPGIATWYDETSPQDDATIKYNILPVGDGIPIGAASGISGLTSPRIPYASSSTSLTDASSLFYNAATKSVVINNVTANPFSGHNGGVIDGGMASLLLSQDNFSAVLQNAYLDVDYKAVGGANASALIQDNGSFYFLAQNGLSAGATISWIQRFRITTTGAWQLNSTPGTAGQILMSNGSTSNPTWETFNSSQWMDVVSPVGIKYIGGNVGIGVDALAPLHVNANTSGAGNYAARISDNNSSNGAEVVLDFRGAAANEKVKVWIADGNGQNWGKRTDAFGNPVIQMTLDHAGELGVGTDNPLFKLDVNGKAAIRTMDSTGSPANMVWQDPNTKEFKLAAVPAGGAGTVSSFSFTDGGGFDGTVANSTTTPALSIVPSFSGLVYSDGSTLAATTVSNLLEYAAGTLQFNDAYMAELPNTQISLKSRMKRLSFTVSDANFSTLSTRQEGFFVLPDITANRTFSMFSGTAVDGVEFYVFNNNTSGSFSWSFTGVTPQKASDGTSVSTMVNGVLYHILGVHDGVNPRWIVVNQ